MKTIRRSIICEECKLPRRTKHWFDVCDGCVNKLRKSSELRCGECGIRVFRLQPDSNNCRRCAQRISNAKIICEGCGIADYPFVSDPVQCRNCHRKALHRIWVKSLPRKIVCDICGATKPADKKTEMICRSCNTKRKNGEVKCTISGCAKLIRNKKWRLCKYHQEERLAPALLIRYINSYISPFPQNERYFQTLFAKLTLTDSDTDITTIRTKDQRRCRAIGEYLRVYELPESLTWHAIQEALPKLSKRGRPRSKAIRSGLLELGNLFAEQGLLPNWNSYLWERRLAQYLRSAPKIFRVHVSDFEKWASQGMVNPKLDLRLLESSPLANTTEAILETVKAAVIFLNWCVDRNIFSLADIDQGTIVNYKENLFWQHECKTCLKRSHLELGKTSETCSNKECNAINSNVRVRRLARASVTRMTMNLRVFFNWAQLHDMVLENPLERHTNSYKGTFTVTNAQGEMTEIADSIRRYDDDVVESLCSYIVSPDADPEEALVLYLIIFHLLTLTELCNAKIPSLVAAGSASAGDFDRAKDFEHLLLPVRTLSRGRLSTRRHDPILKFPNIAASWLVPLLKRYFVKRGRTVSSEYLFARHRQVTRHSRPVSCRYISQLVHRASLRVLKGTVNPRDLRGTAAAIFAQRSKRRGAILTKLGYKSLRATRFNYLETFLLAPRTTSTSTGRRRSSSAKERGNQKPRGF